jgi:predicted GIY-YIG superfamily endonuclease
MRTIRPTELENELEANGLAGVPSMIHGGPGEGKSQLVYNFANKRGAKLYELRANLFDPVDVRGGLKVVEMEDGTYKTRYGIPEDYPPSDYEGTVVLFIDEITNAPKATQNALLQLLLDDKIGTYHLPKNTIKIAAGNRAQDRAAVHEMPTPVKNRFAHYTVEAHIDDWVAWAINNDVDPSIIAFLRYRPALLSSVDSKENAFPTPRAWEFLNKKLPFMKDEFYGCASIIGDGPAGEYIAFKSIYQDVPDIDDLIKKPSHTKVPTNASVLYAIAGALASRVDTHNFEQIMKYVRRMPAEYQVIIVRDCMAKDNTLSTHTAFQKWTQDNASVLL